MNRFDVLSEHYDTLTLGVEKLEELEALCRTLWNKEKAREPADSHRVALMRCAFGQAGQWCQIFQKEALKLADLVEQCRTQSNGGGKAVADEIGAHKDSVDLLIEVCSQIQALCSELVSDKPDAVVVRLAFDVAVHLGTLMAVMTYYRRDLFAMIGGAGQAVTQRTMNDDLKLGLLVVLATIPAVLFGFLGDDWIERELRSALVIAVTTLVFGALLWAADAFGKRQFSLVRLGVIGAIFIGLAQALALIPGTSRSGITITAALALGYQREDAARFSFLLSIPVILGAGLLKTKDLIEQQVAVDWGLMALGAVVSAITAYLTIVFFIRLLERIGMLPFVVYRLILGIALLAWLA